MHYMRKCGFKKRRSRNNYTDPESMIPALWEAEASHKNFNIRKKWMSEKGEKQEGGGEKSRRNLAASVKKVFLGRAQWLMPIIPAFWEAKRVDHEDAKYKEGPSQSRSWSYYVHTAFTK
ncbi:hypothetical protein AAY473_002090 [Plecturocebus cupreus]